MPFVFKPEMASPKQQKKLEEATRRRDEVFSQHPEIAELDQEIKKKEFILRGANFHGLNEEERKQLQKEIKTLKGKQKKILVEKGIPEDFKQPRWDCRECQDRGEILTSEGYVRCSCNQERDLSLIRRKAGIPPRYDQAKFATANLDLYPAKGSNGKESPKVKARKTYKTAQEFAHTQLISGNSQGLLIDGPVGSGKTFLLACIANELLAHGKPVRYISYSDFLFLVRLSFAPDSPYSEYQLIHEIERAPLLIIDDLGTEQATEFSSSLLYRIIDHRYGRQLPFVISTSCSLNDLARRLGFLGEKIMQRIIESCRICGLKGDIRQILIAKERGTDG